MKKKIMIEGMTCMHCVGRVKNTLEEMSGIKEVMVDLEGKSATIKLEKDVEDEILKEKIEDAGYDVVEIKTV
ncbi:heavy-metal-associated domain-containing protein [Lutibacter sp. B2]|nr:heavy-metal-associated domain-containing protein [Lutibacter sp. B2]